MDEFLDKLEEDQRRMRKYLSAKGLRFRAMGEALAECGDAGGRVFIAGEPPLDLLTRVIGREYFVHLTVVVIDDPEETAIELTDNDVLLAFLHDGKHKRLRRLLERARARHSTVLIIGGLAARTAATKRQAQVLITLPTRGIKTVVESSFICARILARVSRAAMSDRSHEGEAIESSPSEAPSRSESRRSKSEGESRRVKSERKGSSRRSKSKGESRTPSGRSKSSSRKKRRKRKLKPSVLEMQALSPEDLESHPLAAPSELEEIPVDELPSEFKVQRGSGSRPKSADLDEEDLDEEDLDEADLDEADLDEADLDEADLDEEDLDEEDLDDVDLDEDLDDLDDLDDVDLDEDLDDPFEDDPFEDIDLEDAGPPSKKPDSRREPISRQPDGTLAPVSVGAEGSGLVPDTRSERFTLPPDPLAQDDAPVGLVSREDPPAGPTFGSDIMLGSDAGFPGADLGPISFDDDFLSDLEVKPPSASRSGSESEDGISARMVSARFSVRDCTIRWGRGGFPDDSSPAHTLIDFDGAQALFLLDHDDEAAATLQIEDELWVRIEVPAFLEPILTRARILDLVGSAGNGGTTATLEFSELEAHTRRKLERAAAARR